jgi:putative toxin-antitoxin system antitoxin component (TIGR02293 family)
MRVAGVATDVVFMPKTGNKKILCAAGAALEVCHVAGYVMPYGTRRFSMASIASVLDLMGAQGLLSNAPAEQLAVVQLVRKGVPWRNFVMFTKRLSLTKEAAASALHIPMRTLARRRKEKRLDAFESERFLRLVRTAAKAEEVLGSLDKAKRWLSISNRALGGEVPISLLDTDIGAQAVDDVLGRIEHGVYS